MRLHPFLLLFGVVARAALCTSASAIDDTLTADQARVSGDGATHWYEARLLRPEGLGWPETSGPYGRLPAKAKGVVRGPVWSLGRHSAGVAARFATDATTIKAHWQLTSPRLAMPHMAATGVSGLDLYVKTGEGEWRWLAVGRPVADVNEVTLVSGLPAAVREYMLYLPLYNGVEKLEIGIPARSHIRSLPRKPGRRRPIVFYGTSITQGGCASRPGMVHTAILGRRLDRPVINLGFSGNGKMEPEVVDLLGELDAAVYVIDCLPNMVAGEVAARTEPLVRKLRSSRPDVPIVLVEDRTYADAFLIASKRERNADSRRVLRAAFERLQASGIPKLYYIPGENQLGSDGEATVDSSHPTDLGFLRMADAFESPLRKALAEKLSDESSEDERR